MTADTGPFRTLLLDPPWSERGGGQIKRGADRHYTVLTGGAASARKPGEPAGSSRALPGIIRGSGLWNPADDAHCYLWATNNYLPDGLWLMGELGFRYVTSIVWVKTRPTLDRGALLVAVEALLDGDPARAFTRSLRYGIGQYFRGGHELMLFGVRGAGKGPDVFEDRRDLGSVIVAPRADHSAKPPESYDLIEKRSKGPRVEFFARSLRPGWTSWGNELEREEEPE